MEKISWEHLFILPSNLIEYLNLVKHTIKHIWLKIWIFGWSYHQTKSGTLSQRNSRKRAHWCICHINEEVGSDLSINHFKLDFKFKTLTIPLVHCDIEGRDKAPGDGLGRFVDDQDQNQNQDQEHLQHRKLRLYKHSSNLSWCKSTSEENHCNSVDIWMSYTIVAIFFLVRQSLRSNCPY